MIVIEREPANSLLVKYYQQEADEITERVREVASLIATLEPRAEANTSARESFEEAVNFLRKARKALADLDKPCTRRKVQGRVVSARSNVRMAEMAAGWVSRRLGEIK
jgi:hypothetical protein